MLNIDKAKHIALKYIKNELQPKSEIAIFENEILEYEEGYILQWNTKAYIIDGVKGARVPGCSPIFVSKFNGEVFDPYVSKYIGPEDLILLYREKQHIK